VRILSVVHESDAGAEVFGAVAQAAGHELVEWVPSREPPPAPDGYGAAMVFGGSMNVDQEDVHPWLAGEKRAIARLVEAGTPVLGVCLGCQLLAEATGGSAARASRPEIGWHEVQMTAEAAGDPVLGELPATFEAFQWHSYAATPPPGAVTLAHSPVSVQAYRIGDTAWGIQFHAEVSIANATDWIEEYDDPDARRIGLDRAPLMAETREKMAAWNDLGRGISARFLEAAAIRA
jgi:GMP synthase-like glutamine amidotransferase